MFICLLIFFFFFFWVSVPRVKDERFIPILLISLCSSRNGQNILYRHAIWYGNTTCFTSGQIPASFMKFRPFHHVLANFDWNVHFSRYQILTLKKKKGKKKKKTTNPLIWGPYHVVGCHSSSSLLRFSFFFLFFFFYSFNFIVSTFYCLLESNTLLSFNFY